MKIILLCILLSSCSTFQAGKCYQLPSQNESDIIKILYPMGRDWYVIVDALKHVYPVPLDFYGSKAIEVKCRKDLIWEVDKIEAELEEERNKK